MRNRGIATLGLLVVISLISMWVALVVDVVSRDESSKPVCIEYIKNGKCAQKCYVPTVKIKEKKCEKNGTKIISGGLE